MWWVWCHSEGFSVVFQFDVSARAAAEARGELREPWLEVRLRVIALRGVMRRAMSLRATATMEAQKAPSRSEFVEQ